MRFIILLGCVTLLVACTAGSGRGLDANGRPIGETPAPGDLPTLANIQARVFTPICTQCHIGAAAPQGLRLDSVNAFNDLVGVPSREVGSLLRVEPFNPDDSYLVRKIEGTAAVGGRMPLGMPALPSADIQLIRQWILEGAMNTPADLSAGTRVASVQVHEDTIQVAFSTALDATTVHTGTVALVDQDGRPVEGFAVSVAPANPRAVFVRLPADRPAGVPFRLAVSDQHGTAVLDRAGRPVEPFRIEFQ